MAESQSDDLVWNRVAMAAHSCGRKPAVGRLIVVSLLVGLFLAPTPYSWGQTDSSPTSEVRWSRSRGEDWPRMLGRRYDSTSQETGILKDWGKDGLRIVWSAPTGVGYGNGVAAAGRWFQFDRFGDKERLTCHHAETGKVLWTWEHPVVYSDAYGYNNGPRCSPVVDDDRVYVYGVTGTLACLATTDGKPLWVRDVNEEFGVIPNFFGVGASPLVYRDLLWVMVGGSPKEESQSSRATLNDIPAAKPSGCGMVGFDKRTGEVRQQVGDYLASYSAPVVRNWNGKDRCLALMREGLISFDPSNGSNELFFPWRSKSLESVNAASPVLVDDHILIGEAYEIGGVLLRSDRDALTSEWSDPTLRKDQQIRPHWTNPLVIGKDVFLSSGRNGPDTDLRCVRFEKGNGETWSANTRWSVRNRNRMTGIAIDDCFLLLGEYGSLHLVAANSERLQVLAEMDLNEKTEPITGAPYIQTPSWAPPVVSHGLLYVRGADRVICLELIP